MEFFFKTFVVFFFIVINLFCIIFIEGFELKNHYIVDNVKNFHDFGHSQNDDCNNQTSNKAENKKYVKELMKHKEKLDNAETLKLLHQNLLFEEEEAKNKNTFENLANNFKLDKFELNNGNGLKIEGNMGSQHVKENEYYKYNTWYKVKINLNNQTNHGDGDVKKYQFFWTVGEKPGEISKEERAEVEEEENHIGNNNNKKRVEKKVRLMNESNARRNSAFFMDQKNKLLFLQKNINIKDRKIEKKEESKAINGNLDDPVNFGIFGTDYAERNNKAPSSKIIKERRINNVSEKNETKNTHLNFAITNKKQIKTEGKNIFLDKTNLYTTVELKHKVSLSDQSSVANKLLHDANITQIENYGPKDSYAMDYTKKKLKSENLEVPHYSNEELNAEDENQIVIPTVKKTAINRKKIETILGPPTKANIWKDMAMLARQKRASAEQEEKNNGAAFFEQIPNTINVCVVLVFLVITLHIYQEFF